MTYAMAIVRFINGMADPLQTGPYARPISMIAQRLGIPIELVQLRHQATHEDLPSLSVLRAGLWTCIAYLRDNSFGPLIFASDPSIAYGTSTSRDAQRQDLSNTLSSLIKRYKRLMKAYFATRTSKAASSTGSAWSGGADLRKVMREMEELWNVDDEDVGLSRDVLVDALVRTGCLVPLARK
jgi:ribosomal biogenesis protein LAS1